MQSDARKRPLIKQTNDPVTTGIPLVRKFRIAKKSLMEELSVPMYCSALYKESPEVDTSAIRITNNNLFVVPLKRSTDCSRKDEYVQKV